MPVIQISALPQPPGTNLESVIVEISTRVAEVMAIPPGQVWTTWQTIDPGRYVEGGLPARMQPRGTHPPIVNVLAYQGRSDDMIRQVLETIASILSQRLQIDQGSTFVTWTELRAGRVFTGGAVR